MTTFTTHDVIVLGGGTAGVEFLFHAMPAGHEAYLVFDGALCSAQVYLNGSSQSVEEHA